MGYGPRHLCIFVHTLSAVGVSCRVVGGRRIIFKLDLVRSWGNNKHLLLNRGLHWGWAPPDSSDQI
jgi:hypothetical protein